MGCDKIDLRVLSLSCFLIAASSSRKTLSYSFSITLLILANPFFFFLALARGIDRRVTVLFHQNNSIAYHLG